MASQQSIDPYLLETNHPETLTNVCIAVIVLTTAIFGFYMVGQLRLNNAAGIEPRLYQPLAWICIVGEAICGILLVKNGGAGQRYEYLAMVNPRALDYFVILTPPIEILYFPGVTLPKLTIVTLYLRIFVGTWVRRIARATQVAIALHLLTGILLFLFICWPFRNKWENPGACGRTTDYYRYYSVPGLVIDVLIVALPMPALWRLQMSKLRKVGIAVVFLVGSLGIVAGVIRFIFFLDINPSEDFTYRTIAPMTVTNAEGAAYFICSCLPGSRQLLAHLLADLKSAVSRSSSRVSLLHWRRARGGSQSSTALHKTAESKKSAETEERGSGAEEVEMGGVEVGDRRIYVRDARVS